ncbi:LPXTG cell wall anchor domain-containing protein (plasmid) [Clostridium perfringens]
MPKTGDAGTVGFGLLGVLSIVGLVTLNKYKFE